jgi:hypothetical protein
MTARASLHRRPVRVSMAAVLALGAGALTLVPGAAPSAAAAGLVPWGSCDALLQHYRAALSETFTHAVAGAGGGLGIGGDDVAVASGAGAVRAEEAASDTAGGAFDAVGSGPTGTNVQERGVDEPDTVKAAGGLLFVSSPGRLQVLRPGPQPELLATLPLGEQGSLAELLVDGDRVLALVSGWRPLEPDPAVPPLPLPEPLPGPVDPIGPSTGDAEISLPAPGAAIISAVLVDVADPASPRVLETVELDGGYVSARLVDGTVRLVTASSPRLSVVLPVEPYGPAQESAALEQNRWTAEAVTLEQVLPQAVHRDERGQVLSSAPAVSCDAVHHAAAGPHGTSSLLVTTLRPSQGLAAVDSTAVTTDGELVYASTDRLYVATSRWGTVEPASTTVPGGEPVTELHAFDTSAGDRTPYLGSGAVRGYVYGRWALSSHEGHLRVATTLQPPWGGDARSSSSLAVLAERDGGLVETGRVDGLGVDERIYAVRYFGDLATVVTFRETDPLYVVDLADPTAPRVLGELKIPGFSTYLHPVGEGRLLGVGQDADATGRTRGLQLSLFDLTDLTAPRQVDRLSLGPGWSPVEHDSRAFSYDPARQLAALPFADDLGRSGALGVRVEGGRLVEAGRLQVGPGGSGRDVVERTLLVEGSVLAVTPSTVVAADAGSWQRTGAVALPG